MIQQLASPPVRSRQAVSDDGLPEEQLSSNKQSSSSARWNWLLRFVRKIHLYSGLFMFPWVMLYAITGYLFNHPRVFSDRTERVFGGADIRGTDLEHLPRPAELAQQVVAAINSAELQKQSENVVRLLKPEEARFSRGQALVSALVEGQRQTVLVDLHTGQGSVRTRGDSRPPAATANSPPFADRELFIDDSLSERLRTAVPTVLANINLPAGEVTTVTLPELQFQAEAAGQTFFVSYSLDRGTLVARDSQAAANALPTRNFLTRLHTAHGYASENSARWFWALAVDAMFVSMCFWGLSGILMWWQLKATRRWGIAFLLASALIAAAMTVGMHRELSANPPPGRGPEGAEQRPESRGRRGGEKSSGPRESGRHRDHGAPQ